MFNKFTLPVLLIFLLLPFADGVKGQTGSIWPASGMPGAARTLYQDQTATAVGDLITIVVNLSAVSTKNQSTDTSKTAGVNDTITALGYPFTDGDPDWFRYRNMAPQMNWSADQSWKGGGKISNTEVFTTTIQARVVDALPNGVLRVEARRRYAVNKEKSDLVLTGLVRREDLSVNNSVESSRVADMQISQEGQGPLSRNQQKGWLTTIYEFLNPF